MTWSFSGDPANSNLDNVRVKVGDIDTTDQLVTDEIINFAISDEPTLNKAAAYVFRHLSAKFARKADKNVGDLKITFSQLAKQYLEQAKAYDTKDDSEIESYYPGVVPYSGGISIADKDSTEGDTDRTSPYFYKGMHDKINPERQEDSCD